MSRQSEKDRRKDNCIECDVFKPIKAKDMCQNCWHKFKRRNQPEFFLRTRFTEIVQRCENPNNKKAKTYLGKSHCTRNEFLYKFLHDSKFLKLFQEWKKSKWDNKKCPSVDRIDVEKDYTLDNIQIISHSENCTKDQIKQKVFVYSKDRSKLLFTFNSQADTARTLNIPQANIWKVINGERKSAGGFYFVGGDYENS